MIRRILATLAALLLIGAAAPVSNEHTIHVGVSQTLNLSAAHVFVGVAVLGPKVGRIERGWIVKQAREGFLHIDWTKGGNWNGLTRTEQGPRDVTQAQVQSVIYVIESLGYPASAIRSWRVAAPVGYDGFGDGDKVLTIGEILVDLGTADQARLALDRWWDAVEDDDKDPFEKLPHLNVRYASNLYFGPDCTAMEQQLRAGALAQSQTIAQGDALADYQSSLPENVLCPADRQPNFYNVRGVPPIRIDDSDLSETRTAHITYTLPGAPLHQGPPLIPDDLSRSGAAHDVASFAQPYAVTTGAASVMMKPDALVLRFTYDLATKARKGYDADLRNAQANVAALRQLVPAAGIATQRFPAQEREDEISVFVLLRGADMQRLNDLRHAGSRNEPVDSVRYTALFTDCDTPARNAVAQALAQSRRKAAILAKLMRTAVREAGTMSVEYPIDTSVLCGYDPRTPLSALLPQLGFENEAQLGKEIAVTANAGVTATWILSGAPSSGAPLVRTEYRAEVIGSSPIASLEDRVMVQAWHEAFVDNPHIHSVILIAPLVGSVLDGRTEVSQTIIVLR